MSTLIIDGHLDLAHNALFHRRDLTQSVDTLREREDGFLLGPTTDPEAVLVRHDPWADVGKGIATVSFPDMRKGHVGIALGTIMARVQEPGPTSGNTDRTQAAAYARAMGHLAYYRALKRDGQIRFIKSLADLDASVAEWAHPTPETPIGLILTMESADPILGPENVEDWWKAGLRAVSLTHYGANTYGHGTRTVGGLYAPAFPLMDALRAAGMVLDVTHAADLALRQILDRWDGPIHASHCNCRALVPIQRLLSDDVIKTLCERGGVIGVVFVESFLNPAWIDSDRVPPTSTRPMNAVVDHVDHICQLAGNADHVAIGSDLDGGFGREYAPTDMDTIADLQKFLDILRQRGYGEEDVAKIAHGNTVRLFREAWQ